MPLLAYISLSAPRYYFCGVTGTATPTGAVEIGVNLENTTPSSALTKTHIFVIRRQCSHTKQSLQGGISPLKSSQTFPWCR